MLSFMFNWGPHFPVHLKKKSWTSRRQSKGPASPIDAHSSLAELRVYRGDSGWGLSLPLGGNFLRLELRGSSVGWQPPSIDRCPNQPFFATLEPSTVKNRPPIRIQLEWWKRWFTVPRRASRKDWALVKRWQWSWEACWTSRASRAPAPPTRGSRGAWRSRIVSSGQSQSQGVKPDKCSWNQTLHCVIVNMSRLSLFWLIHLYDLN